MTQRDTYKYQLKEAGKIVHRGITNDLERREREHQAEHPGSRIKQVGRQTTRDAALKWEREGGKRRYRKRRYGLMRTVAGRLQRVWVGVGLKATGDDDKAPKVNH